MEIVFRCGACSNAVRTEGMPMGASVACPACSAALTVPNGDFAPGTRIAGFEIVRPLGKGGMGEVYLARQMSMGREIALKILSAEFAAQPGAVERFLKEVQVAARLEHPHIVTAYDAGEDDGLYYMAMHYIPGQSLAAILGPGVALAERDALTMTRKLAHALDHAWTRFHIIHRDINPGNILFDADGEPKLADMGLSRSRDEADGPMMADSVMGTPNYMSPEQAEGRSDLDFRADVYSLGATLYHAVTGLAPFDDDNVLEILRRQATEVLPDPRDANPQISEHCVGLLRIMLAKNREDRYADWKDLIRDIDAVLASKPPAAVAPGEGRSLMGHKSAGHTTQIKLVLPKGGIHPHPAAASSSRPAKPASPARQALVLGIVAVLCVGALAAFLGVRRAGQRAELERQRTAQAAQEAADRRQAGLWQTAVDFAAANPGEFDRAIAGFEDAAKQLAGTRYEAMAKAEVDRLRAARAAAVEAAFAGLEAGAKEAADRKDFEAAAGVFTGYTGAFAAELAERMASAARRYRDTGREAMEMTARAESEGKQKETETLAAVADAASEGDFTKARQACGAFLDDATVAIDKDGVRRIAAWMEQADSADRMLLATFEAQKGTSVQLMLDGAKTEVRIAGVQGDRIRIDRRKGMGWVTAELIPAQIPFEEQCARLKDKIDPAALGIRAGAAMMRARRPDLAAPYFQSAGPLSDLLVAKTESAKSGEREAASEAALAKILRAVGLPAGAVQPEAIAARIQPGKPSPSQAAAVLRQLDAYTAAFGDTKSAISAAPTSDALRDALEAARKGAPAPVAAAAPEAKLDDFGRRVVEAREHKGEILRCSADGRGGTLSYLEALKRLKRNMILQLEAGAYPDDPILTPGVYLEFEPNVVGNITVSAARCVVRKATQAIVHFKPAAPGDELLAVDSEISIECHRGGAASLFNCIVNVHWISGDTKIYFRHCTFVFRPAEFAISTAGDSTSIRLDDCVAWCDRGAAFGIGKPHPGTVFVECRRCLLPGRMGVLADNTASGSTSMGTPVPASSFKLVDCVQKDEDAVKTFVRGRIATVLGFHSGARGLAAGGRDPGAWLDEDATIRPLDPAIPAAKSNSGRRPGTAPRTPSGESPAVR